MKICGALVFALLVEGRGVANHGRRAPLTVESKEHAAPVLHAAVATGGSHKTVASTGKGEGHISANGVASSHKSAANAGTGEGHVTTNSVASSHKSSANAGKIVPPLVDVDTDKKFFGPPFPADYPDDISPPADGKLFKKGWVYPKVQEEGSFDKDYVKDENADQGQWKAQSDYDAARTKIFNQKRQLENAMERAENEGRDVADAAKKVEERQEKESEAANDAKASGEAAKSVAERAQEEARKRAEKRAADKAAAEAHAKAEEDKRREEENKVLEKKVKDAEDALAKQTESYKECEKELQRTKAQVDDLQKQRDVLEKDGSGAAKTVSVFSTPEELENERKAAEEAGESRLAAEAKHLAAKKDLEAARRKKEEATHELDKQKSENADAQAAAKKEEEHVKDAEKDVEESGEKLRRMRGLEAVPGATPAPPKAGAVGMSMSATVAVFLLFSVAL